MDMLKGDQIAKTNLADWRKLAQGLHARYLVGDFNSTPSMLVRGLDSAQPTEG